MEEGGGFTNVHRQIRKLFKSGIIELVDSEELDYRGQPYKTLRVKENA
jgi:predicted transcriptional regulator